MDIRIKAIHFDVNERLQDFIQKKVGKLGRFGVEIGKVEVSLKVVKPEVAMNKQVDLKADVPGKSLLPVKHATHLKKRLTKRAKFWSVR